MSLTQEQTQLRSEFEQNITNSLTNYQILYNNIASKNRQEINKVVDQINTHSAQLVKYKHNFIKLLDETQKEEEKLTLAKKNLEFLHLQNQDTGGSNTADQNSSQLYSRFLSVFESSPEHEIERSLMKIDKLEKEIEKKRVEMEAKKRQLLHSLEEKDRVLSTVYMIIIHCLTLVVFESL